MIEIEKKFAINEDTLALMESIGEFISEKVFVDIYFDNDKLILTTKDTWLRQRGDHFELKVSKNNVDAAIGRKIDQYEEIEDEEAIAIALGIKFSGNLYNDLRTNGYLPFCRIETRRRKYKAGDFVIDIDEMDFGYNIAEIELLLEKDDPTEKEIATNRILNFAREHQLELSFVRGKVIEYLFRNNREHYDKLVVAGVI